MVLQHLRRAVASLCVFISFAASAIADADVPAETARRDAAIPGSPAGRRFEEWLAAFNSGDSKLLMRFHTSSVARARTSAEQRTEMHAQAALFSGGLKIRETRPVSKTVLEVDAETKQTGDAVAIRIEVSPEAPHGVTDFAMRLTPRSVGAAGRMSEAQIAEALDAHLDRLVAADAFTGVVLLAKDGKTFLARAYGEADRRHHTPNMLDTRFSLASLGKMFTAVAVVRLVEQHKLALDGTVGEYLPDYPNQKVAESVTIRQLLTHTSGMGDIFEKEGSRRRSRLDTISDTLAAVAEDELAFEPGSKWQYSNAGYVLLGAIIEKVTGRSYGEVIAEEVFGPAGMRDSGFFAQGDKIERRAVGYTVLGADDHPSADKTPRPVDLGCGGPAGGAWSTAEDLLRFSNSLRKHVLVTPDMLAEMTRAQAETGMGPGAAYGYGFEIQPVNGEQVVGHYGGFPGVSDGFEMYPALGYTVIILSNSDMGGQRVIGPLHEWLTQR